jgi:preprotein translocase subunit SecD
MTNLEIDAERLRSLLHDFDAGPVPEPDLARIMQRGRSRNRWRTADRSLALVAVGATAVVVVLLVVLAVRPRSEVPPTTSPTPSAAAGYRLEIRPVLTLGVASSGSCPSPVQQPASATGVRACSADGTQVYTLGPAAVTGEEFAGLDAAGSSGPGSGFVVVTRLTDAGSAHLKAVTTTLATQPAPQNQLAFYAGGVVLSAPYVSQPILGGSAVVGGFSSLATAQQFVDSVTP